VWHSIWWVRASLVMFCVFLVDHLTKSAVDSAILPGAHRSLMRGVELVDVRDNEFVLGFIPVGSTLRLILGIIGLSFAFVLFFKSIRGRSTGRPFWLPIGLMLGGGFGNIFDLASKGAATDFIELSRSRVAFNLADAAVLIGMLLMILLNTLGPLSGRPADGQALG
jgi:lipoprotein signal peptidase